MYLVLVMLSLAWCSNNAELWPVLMYVVAMWRASDNISMHSSPRTPIKIRNILLSLSVIE